MEDEDVDLQATDYMKHMSVDFPISGPYREQIKAAIWETSREVFGEMRDMIPVVPFVPSSKAGYNAPRYSGGIAGELIRECPGLLEPRRAVLDAWMNGEQVTVTARPYDFAHSYMSALEDWGNRSEVADCQIYMIREPLKLRTITAGTPSLYGNTKPILAWMRSGLGKFDCFRLTRRENNAAWLGERLNRVPDGFHSQWKLINSGDYQQSTNDLSMEATSEVRASIVAGTIGWMVRAALGAQKLHWADEQVLQDRGQLMGSPLSFPVLCVINAALKRLAYQLAYNRWWGKSLDFFPFAVNGDDIVARVDLRVFSIWEELLAGVGWRLSPGKSYLHWNLAQVNSQTMNVQWVRDRCVLSSPIPFVNDGFIHQMGKSCSQIDESPLDAMSEDWQKRWESFERLPEGMRKRAREVMVRNLDQVCQRLYREGWTPFVMKPGNPVGFGGFGIGGLPFDKEAAWLGYCSSRPKQMSLEEKIGQTSAPEAEPFLKLRRRSCPEFGVLDALVLDLEEYVASRERYDPSLPVGLVDPVIKRVAVEDKIGVELKYCYGMQSPSCQVLAG